MRQTQRQQRAQRQRPARRQQPDRFAGFARGWFVVAFSHEIAPGQVQTLTYFGTKLAMFRGQSGRVSVLDAYCPHLGANLGGGEVVGDSVQCPFHSWRFDQSGRCVAIPYAERIPKKAVTTAWPVDEKNGMIFVWHDPAGGPPTYEIPLMPEYGTTEWLSWRTSRLRIKTHPKEIVENVVDKAHFSPVHSTEIEEFENEFVDHMAIQRTKGTAYPQGGGVDRFRLTATYYGPAYQVSEMHGVLESRMVNAHTPVDEHSLDLRFGVTLKVLGDRERTKVFADRYVDNLHKGFQEDIAIWEGKLYREVPVLCDGDGPIIRLRTWYAQFYAPAAESREQVA